MLDYKRIIDFISYLFFTNPCKLCDEPIHFGETLCDECKSELVFLRPMNNMCSIKYGKKYFDDAYAAFYFDSLVRKAIWKYKFRFAKYKSDFFAEEICALADKFTKDVDAVTYVPMSESSLKKREYDHAALLAEKVADRIGVPMENLVVRIKDKETQHHLGAAARAANVRGMFDGIKTEHKRIILIDDIFTTGATANECCRQIKKYNKDIKIFVLCVAKSRIKLKMNKK